MRMRGTVALAAMAMLAACGPSQATNPKPSPSPSRGASVRTTPLPLSQVPPDVQKQWADLGATIVPPTDYLQHIDLKAEVINHSGGKVDDATARKWAEGEARGLAWDGWAVMNLQSAFLASLGPSDINTQQAVFGDDYGYIRKATDAGGRISGHTGTEAKMVLVAVPQGVKDQLTGAYGYPGPVPDWALVVTVTGPVTVVLTKADGSSQQLVNLPASFREDAFLVGEYKDYPNTLGGIWYSHTYLSCPQNDFLRATCAG